MLKPEYSRQTWPIPWQLMPWLPASPGHQRPLYWLCKIGMSLSSMGKDFNYLSHLYVEKWLGQRFKARLMSAKRERWLVSMTQQLSIIRYTASGQAAGAGRRRSSFLRQWRIVCTYKNNLDGEQTGMATTRVRINSLTPGIFEWNLREVIFKLILTIYG